MANGDQAISVLLGEVDDLIRKESDLDPNTCPVGPECPRAMFLMLKLQRASLQQGRKTQFGVGVAGGGVGFGILYGIIEVAKALSG